MRDKALTIRISEEDRRKLKSRLALKGKTISDFLREKIKEELSPTPEK